MNMSRFYPLFLSRVVCLYSDVKNAEKVVAAQRLFEPKALHITAYVDRQKLAE